MVTNKCSTSSPLHCFVSGSIRSFTYVGMSTWCEMVLKVYGTGNHGSSFTRMLSPFPTIHLNPATRTLWPCRIPFQPQDDPQAVPA
ncbi:hypothetical protein PRUPE_1G092600 [Prunus persica]|uniref:Uncharacterized protein n=1 Tax=Prunus persica TaxID=3760 RepID=A0A251QUL8_PRUPE|nr:hypothetical protein PRUPE_1G092600 [Prunus persica]